MAGLRPSTPAVGAGVLFALVAALWALGVLDPLDLLVAHAADPGIASLLQRWFPLVAALWSPEASLLYGLVLSLALARWGLGPWSLSPMAFLLLVPLEVALKLAGPRPALPSVLKPWPAYPLVNLDLGASLLNGSPLRTGFLCVFLAALLWPRKGGLSRLGAVALVGLALFSSFIRVYGGYHWLTNEVASLILGVALGLQAAVPAALRLTARSPGHAIARSLDRAPPPC